MKNALLTSLACASAAMIPAQQSQRPNVIFFLADDLGWTDLACYGSDFYETPNIDRLAREGMLFTDAYAACPVSSPTRVSIQTGRYPVRTGVTDFIRGRYHVPQRREEMKKLCPVLPPDNVFNMPPDEVTIAEALKPYGYKTVHIGKWHVAEDSVCFPQYQGYDINIAGCGKGSPGKDGYFVPYHNPYLPDGPEGEYLTDRLGDECVKTIGQLKDGPFFINFPFYQVHTPILAKQDRIRYFEEKAHRMGLDTISVIYDENPEWKEKQPFGAKSYHDRIVQNNPVYAAMISGMDENIGKVIAELKRLGLYENTIIIFTSDNGGLSTSEGAPTSNLPLKAGKGHLYEGGIREPLIAVWKGHIRGNTVSDHLVSSVDYFPTILGLLDIPLPEKTVLDGKSFKGSLSGKEESRGPVFWHYPHYPNQGARPGSAVREGDYKLIEFLDNGDVELYNLKDDIGEMKNLMGKEPEKAKELLTKLHDWRLEVHAKMPVANPDYKGKK